MRMQRCASISHLLEAYHDGELPIGMQIAVESHVAECATCHASMGELTAVRAALREGQDAPFDPVVDQALAGVGRAVVSRARAEQQQTFPARVSRMFDDLHLVWAGLAATAATATCAALVASVLYFQPAERSDSMAGVLSALAAPGSNRNPMSIDDRVHLPWAKSDADIMPAVVALPDSEMKTVTLAVAGVLTREGRVAHASLLPPNRYDVADARRVIDAVAAARFQPAQRGGLPVAVNLIWVLEQTTVRAKISS